MPLNASGRGAHVRNANRVADSVAEVDTLRNLIADAARVVVFTGAGISTESGIPDFRSPGGIWTKFQPIDFRDFISSVDIRKEAWRRRIGMHDTFRQAQPNRGHRAVAKLVADGKASSVITQNIDGLHQAAGVPDGQVIELHGNNTYAKCLDCSKRFDLDTIIEAFKQDEIPPVCDVCEGIVKTATISFGQMMPEHEMMRSQEEALSCDLFIVMGSSLVVFPAAGFPLLAKKNGAKLVIINRDETDQDDFADLVVHAGIGDTLGSAVGVE